MTLVLFYLWMSCLSALPSMRPLSSLQVLVAGGGIIVVVNIIAAFATDLNIHS